MRIESADLEWLAGIFKALSHPHRLRIFLRLAACCPRQATAGDEPEALLGVSDVGADLELAPSTLSHHIKELKQAGIIRAARQGQSIRCWIDPEVIEALAGFIHSAAHGQPCCILRHSHHHRHRRR
ncbi:helix-turn-helix transcriptional regulator [bacterium]|nr:helix-turn-helix transcriptional regulator [bacterium]